MSFPRLSRPGFAALVALVTLFVAACNYVETTPPAPTPADWSGMAIQFAKRGLHLDNVVSGEPGCDDKVLRPTAIAFDASGLDQATPVRLYLYAFADRATFERLRSSIAGLRPGYAALEDGWVEAVVAGNTFGHYAEHLDELSLR